jgi:hypothetical protein
MPKPVTVRADFTCNCTATCCGVSRFILRREDMAVRNPLAGALFVPAAAGWLSTLFRECGQVARLASARYDPADCRACTQGAILAAGPWLWFERAKIGSNFNRGFLPGWRHRGNGPRFILRSYSLLFRLFKFELCVQVFDVFANRARLVC